MTLPVGPPIKPMLAKLSDDIPRGDGWIYEPKWDGFRTIVYRDGRDIYLRSRNDRPMNRYFPEIEALLLEKLPELCVVDGEIILPTDEGLDFDALQLRLHPAASRVNMLAEQTPASFVGFDVLAHGPDDLRELPFTQRLAHLELPMPSDAAEPATAKGPRVYATPRTTERGEAARWFDDLEKVGLDGLIAKRHDLHYIAGERVMVKVKHRRTADCVVAGYREHKDGKGIGSLLLGVYDNGELHYIGHTASFKAEERRDILALLKPMVTESSFEGDWGPYSPSRWNQGRDTEFFSVRPELVCEVSYDFLQAGYRFRHVARFLRWRDDKKPEECTFEQLRR